MRRDRSMDWHQEPRVLRTCHVADGDCERPAGWGNANGVAIATAADMRGSICVCHRCGLDVCRACSSVVARPVLNKWRVYVRRKVRICADCIREEARS